MSVPALRFKDDDGKEFPEWKEKTLGDVVQIIRGKNIIASTNGKNFLLGMGSVSENGTLIINKKTDDNINFLHENDLIMPERDIGVGLIIGKVAIIKENYKFILGSNLLRLIVKEGILSKFSYYLINSSFFNKQIKEIVNGSAQLMITATEVKKLTFIFPSLPEQTKIANILTAVDQKISLLTQKADLLSQYKKGVMQQIFKQELRFKDDDGKEFPEWEEKRLGDIADLTSSKRVYLSDYVSEGIPFYRGKEISELKRNETPKDILYITTKAYNAFKVSYGVPQVNDILITAVGTLGNVYRIKDDSEFYFKDGNLIWLRDIKISSAFLEILFETNNEAIQKSSIGSSQRALTIVELKKLKFSVPSLPEQTKVANFLTAIDEKITNHQTQLNAVKQYKQGLLQQMFV